MKIYIAGKIRSETERKRLEEIDEVCVSLGFDTFLPHRDVGLADGIEDVDKIFKGDITDGFKDINLVVAVLESLHIGAGTAWELGYAYARGIPAIGIKTDEPVSEALDELSAILVGSMEIVSTIDELKNRLRNLREVPPD